jgi:tRNA (Thr-GGU) A37 N-methylase
MQLRSIGTVESSLSDRAAAPKQGGEGAPDAWIGFVPEVAEAMGDLEALDGTPVVDVKPQL